MPLHLQDVTNEADLQALRQMTGICPQKDALFDWLSVKEHLQFYAAFKGIPDNTISDKVS